MENKKDFVEKHLFQLYNYLDNDIYRLEYAVTQYKEEYVLVHYANGYIKKINVTCDSLRAIVHDTIMKV